MVTSMKIDYWVFVECILAMYLLCRYNYNLVSLVLI